MGASDLIMYEEEFQKIKEIISKLKVDANATVVFLVDKNGQQIAATGDIERLDTTSLASLTAGNGWASGRCESTWRGTSMACPTRAPCATAATTRRRGRNCWRCWRRREGPWAPRDSGPQHKDTKDAKEKRRTKRD